MGDRAQGGGDVGGCLEHRAVGRVEVEFGAVDDRVQLPVGDAGAFEELGQGVGIDRCPPAFGVDFEGRAHRQGAEVEGAGLGGDLTDDREGSPLVGAGEGGLWLGPAGLRNAQRFRARAGGRLQGADPRAGGTCGRGGVGVRAERDALDLRELALREVQGEAAQGLVTVWAGEVEDEGAELPGRRFGYSRLQGGAEALAAAFGDVDVAVAGDGRVVRVGGEAEVGGEGAAVVWVLQRRPGPAPDIQVDLFDRDLGDVLEDRGEAAGL